MTAPMKTVSFKLPEHLYDALGDIARRRKSSRSALVREALELLASRGQRSVTAAVDALVSPLDGPTDLSTTPKHLSAYGE